MSHVALVADKVNVLVSVFRTGTNTEHPQVKRWEIYFALQLDLTSMQKVTAERHSDMQAAYIMGARKQGEKEGMEDPERDIYLL